MLRNVIPIISIVALVAACGDDPDSSGRPPIIRASGMVAQGGAELSGAPAMVSDKMMPPMWITKWEFESNGDLPDLDSPAWAWVLRDGAQPSDEQLETLLEVFDIPGGFTERTEGRGEPWEYTMWTAGSQDGSDASISISDDAMLSWWYSEGYGDVVAIPECVYPIEGDGSAVVGSPASGDAAVSESAVEPMPCGPVEPPVGVPSAREAEDLFFDLASSLGFARDDFDVESYGDEWGAWVNGWLILDGVRSPMSLNASFGENASLTYAGGTLATPEKFAEYPRIGTRAALERLSDEYNSVVYGPMVRGGGVAVDPGMNPEPVTEPAVVAETISPSDNGSIPSPTEPGPDDTIPVDTMPVEPQTVTVDVEGVEEELVYLWSEDGNIYLVPGYAFIATQDGYESRYLVSAMPKEFVEQPDDEEQPSETDVPTTEASETTEVPGGDGGEDVIVPEGDEQALVGLSEKDAIDEANSRGWDIRVVARDGEEFPITMDYSRSRVNITVVEGAVTEVYIG